jgi:hypothetical protein
MANWSKKTDVYTECIYAMYRHTYQRTDFCTEVEVWHYKEDPG